MPTTREKTKGQSKVKRGEDASSVILEYLKEQAGKQVLIKSIHDRLADRGLYGRSYEEGQNVRTLLGRMCKKEKIGAVRDGTRFLSYYHVGQYKKREETEEPVDPLRQVTSRLDCMRAIVMVVFSLPYSYARDEFPSQLTQNGWCWDESVGKGIGQLCIRAIAELLDEGVLAVDDSLLYIPDSILSRIEDGLPDRLSDATDKELNDAVTEVVRKKMSFGRRIV